MLTNKYAHPMPPLEVAMNRAGMLRHYGASADGEQKKLVVLADEVERLRAEIERLTSEDAMKARHPLLQADEPGCRETQAPEVLGDSGKIECPTCNGDGSVYPEVPLSGGAWKSGSADGMPWAEVPLGPMVMTEDENFVHIRPAFDPASVPDCPRCGAAHWPQCPLPEKSGGGTP